MFLHVNRYKSSRSQIPFKTGVLKNFAIFTGKHLCWSLFLIKFLFNKVSLQMTPTQVLSYEYCKIVRNSFFTEHLRWLLLPLNSNKGKKKKVRKSYSKHGALNLGYRKNILLYSSFSCTMFFFIKFFMQKLENILCLIYCPPQSFSKISFGLHIELLIDNANINDAAGRYIN